MRKFAASILLAILMSSFAAGVSYGLEGMESMVIDPGHGGYDFGIRKEKVREKDIAIAIARELKTFLASEEFAATLTRNVDQYLSMSERRNRIDAASPETLVSLHLAAGERANIYIAWYEGTEEGLTLRQYYDISSRQRRHLFASRLLAEAIGTVLRDEFGIEVFIGTMPLPLLLETGAPAVLVELPSEGMSYDPGTITRFAYTLGIGIQAYGNR